ncbi:MAG: class I SAM-dependent methyltransferase [Kovacikia sp.]
MIDQLSRILSPYLIERDRIDRWEQEIPIYPISHPTPALQANSYYFGHSQWGKDYFEACHRDPLFIDRWQAATGCWEGKIVVDIGCGAGNLYAALRDRCGQPQQLIGIDVSLGALKMAQRWGYQAILADAQQLPLVSGFADMVIANATIHHCDDMEKMLSEAARLVRPGGLLVTDHDPQRTAWKDNAIARLLWNSRLPLYRLLKRGGHATAEEQFWSLATEAHHDIGDGVGAELYHRVLEPLGFSVKLYPHNRTVGAPVLEGNSGRANWNIRLAQRLCGVNPDTPEAAILLMCVATRNATGIISI